MKSLELKTSLLLDEKKNLKIMETIKINDKSIFDKKTYNLINDNKSYLIDDDYDNIFKKYNESDYVDVFFKKMKLYKNKKNIELKIGYDGNHDIFFFPEDCLDTEDGDYNAGFHFYYDKNENYFALVLNSIAGECYLMDSELEIFFKNLMKVYKEYNKKDFDFIFYTELDSCEIIHNYGDEYVIIKNIGDSIDNGVNFCFESTYNLLNCFKNKYSKKEHPLKR